MKELGKNMRDDLSFYFMLYKTSLEMNTAEEIKDDPEKKGYLVEYVERLTAFALDYIKELGIEPVKRQERGRPYVLPQDREWYETAVGSITGTQAVKDTTWRFLVEEKDLDGFFTYCDMIQQQTENFYKKYFLSRCQFAGNKCYSLIAGAYWDARKKRWTNGRKIAGAFVNPC